MNVSPATVERTVGTFPAPWESEIVYTSPVCRVTVAAPGFVVVHDEPLSVRASEPPKLPQPEVLVSNPQFTIRFPGAGGIGTACAPAGAAATTGTPAIAAIRTERRSSRLARCGGIAFPLACRTRREHQRSPADPPPSAPRPQQGGP